MVGQSTAAAYVIHSAVMTVVTVQHAGMFAYSGHICFSVCSSKPTFGTRAFTTAMPWQLHIDAAATAHGPQ